MQKMRKTYLVLLILLVLLVSCVEEPEHVHSFDTEWTSDSTYHWHESTCGHDVVSDKAEHLWNDGVATTEPTHTENGEKTFTCTVCGATRTEVIPALTEAHTFNLDWTSDTAYHWHESTCGHDVVSDKAEHIWNDGVVTTEPTHTENGEKTFTCTVCGATKIAVIPAKLEDHSYQDEWISGDFGVKYKTCECGKTYYYGEEYDQYFKVNQNGVLTSSSAKLPDDVIFPTVIDGIVVTEIGERVFTFVTLKNVEIPTSVTKIGAHAFDWSTGLTSITIPDSVTVIGSSAFCRCNDLITITIPASVEIIEESTFWSCENLTSVVISEGTTTIGETAFVFCGNLKDITIPNTVTRIGDSAFYSCRSIEEITIPGSVMMIDEEAFESCTSLTDITFGGTISEWGLIIKGTDWNKDVPAEVVHCTDGDVAI